MNYRYLYDVTVFILLGSPDLGLGILCPIDPKVKTMRSL